MCAGAWVDVSGNQAESGAGPLTARIFEKILFNTVSERLVNAQKVVIAIHIMMGSHSLTRHNRHPARSKA